MNTDHAYQQSGAFIAHLIKNGFKKHGPAISRGEFEVHSIDLTPIKLNVQHMVPFVLAKRVSNRETVTPGQLDQILPDLLSLKQSLQRDIAVLIIGGELIGDESIVEELGLSGIAVMDRSTIESTCANADFVAKSKLLSTPLIRFLGRETLSPYISGRPAVAGRFFGRLSAVKRILPGGGNWTVLGNRRIGKTSLLQEIRARLRMQGVSTCWLYGGKYNSTLDAVHDILRELDQFRIADHVIADPNKAKNLPSYIHRMADSEKKNIAVFIDELDHILDFDAKQNFELLELLRETFQNHDSCRIFMAGFRQVMEASRSLNHPLFNFTKPYELQSLSRDEALEMITKPLSNLGVDLSGSDLANAIYRQTAGQPELIQIHCAEVIKMFEAEGKVPGGPDLFADVFNTEEYKQKVLGTFLANTNPYEELLCYLLIQDAEESGKIPQYEFGPADVDRVLKKVGYNIGLRQIMAIITQLKISGIITPIMGRTEKYKFSVPQFVGYCLRGNLTFSISKALEAAKNCSEEFAYWLDPEEVSGSGGKLNA
ncbi:MAG TPA: AAA family ATPase [Blastocatellia bacterium]|nr:AAA family ATPase [Blastocatellia bacterium]